MKPKEKEKMLARSELFKTLPPEGLNLVAGSAILREFKPGEALLVEGKPADGIYLLVEGTADYIKRMDAKSGLVLFRWQPGDVFGIAAVVEERPPFISAVATSDVKCLFLSHGDFRAVCAASPIYEHRLMTQALLIQSNRLRQITVRLREFLAQILK